MVVVSFRAVRIAAMMPPIASAEGARQVEQREQHDQELVVADHVVQGSARP